MNLKYSFILIFFKLFSGMIIFYSKSVDTRKNILMSKKKKNNIKLYLINL